MEQNIRPAPLIIQTTSPVDEAEMPTEEDVADAIRAYRAEIKRLKTKGLNRYEENV